MIAHHYILSSKRGLSVTLQYSLTGLLTFMQVTDYPDDMGLERFMEFIPRILAKGDLLDLVSGHPSLSITEVPIDLSFDRFWTEYAHKVGAKDKCAKIWARMERIDQIRAISAIRKFRAYSTARGYDMPYPERYLSHSRYNDSLG